MYKLNFIGNGRITLAAIKKIIELNLDHYIESINIWYRQKVEIKNNGIMTSNNSINEDIVNLFILNTYGDNKFLALNKKIKFICFKYLDELKSVNDQNENSIVIITTKYNMDELLFFDIKNKIKFNMENDLHIELLLTRYRSIIADTSLYDLLQGLDLKNKLIHDIHYVIQITHNLESAINILNQCTEVGYERLYNLKNSPIGIINLAKALHGNGEFKGIILNMVNEVDTTNLLLYRFLGVAENKIISPCENDTLRAKYFIRKYLKNTLPINKVSLMHVGPHNHLGFIPEETIRVNGQPINEIIKSDELKDLMVSVIMKVNSFGEEVFIKKASSDEDTIDGLGIVLSAILNGRYKQLTFRGSHYIPEKNVFTGLPLRFNNKSFVVQNELIDSLSEKSKEKISYCINVQSIIDKHIFLALNNNSDQSGERYAEVS